MSLSHIGGSKAHTIGGDDDNILIYLLVISRSSILFEACLKLATSSVICHPEMLVIS